MRTLIICLLFTGCCTVPSIQRVLPVDPIPVDPVNVSVVDRSPDFVVEVKIDTVAGITGKVIREVRDFRVSGDTSLRVDNGSALVRYEIDSRERLVKFDVTVWPDSLRDTILVNVDPIYRDPDPTFADRHFWWILVLGLIGWVAFFILLRGVKWAN